MYPSEMEGRLSQDHMQSRIRDLNCWNNNIAPNLAGVPVLVVALRLPLIKLENGLRTNITPNLNQFLNIWG